MSITQPNGPARGAEQNHTPSTSHGAELKTPEPQKCCSGGNCAECGKQQPVVESSAEIAAIEQQILSGDFGGFFDSLTASRETVGQTIGIRAVVTSGEGSVVQVGQTASTFGTIGPSQSALRYHEAPSLLLSSSPTIAPTAERLVSIGSVPKQAVTEGFSGTGSLRDSITAAESRFPATTSAYTLASAPYVTEASQKPEQARVERNTETRSPELRTEGIRGVEKVATAKVESQETKPWVNTPSPSITTASLRSASYSSSPSTSTFQAVTQPAPQQAQHSAARTVPLQRPISLSLSHSVAKASLQQRGTGTRVSQPRQGKELKALTLKLNLIGNLERFARALSRGGEIATSKTSQRVIRAVQQIERFVKNNAHSIARSPQQRRALDNLRAVVQALVGSRNGRDNKVIARVMSNALLQLGGGIEKRVARFNLTHRGTTPSSTRALTRKALLNARLQNIRGRLERLKARYQAKSPMTRRDGMKRTQHIRKLSQRSISAKQPLRRPPSRSERKSLTRQAATRRQTKGSTRQRNNVRPDHEKQEVRMLRREVKALRQSLQDLHPMIEMLQALSKKRRAVSGEEDFDLRGFISERQLAAILKRRNLSSLERRKIERELAKKRKAKGTGRAMKNATSSSKKQDTTGANASSTATEGAEQPKDGEMKSYAKSLSTFQMRTDDAADEDDFDGSSPSK